MPNRVVLLGLLLLGLLAPDAHAGWIETPTQTENIPLTLTDYNQNTTTLAGKNPFVIQQFNAAQYQASAPPGKTVVLEAVGIRLDYVFQNTISMQFTSSSTITVNAAGHMDLLAPTGLDTGLTGTVTVPPGGPTTVPLLVNEATFANSATVTSTKGTPTAPYSTSTPTQTTGSYSATAYTQANPTVLAVFNGPGTISLPVVASAASNFKTDTGNGLGNSVTAASATLSVVYFYAYVPEPSSMVLTALGGIGLLATCRKRRRRQD